jgi:omega-6 fatty acid desaturase (delta-12 desaturase)
VELNADSRKALLSSLREDTVDRPASTMLISLALFAVYFALLVLTMQLENVVLKTLCSAWLSLYTGNLMVCAHDAAHNAMSRSKALNRWFGAIAMLPSLQPFSIWVRQHNFVHHRYVAQIGIDDTYPPLTPEQYRARSPLGRAYYRFLRSLVGQQFWYFLEITLPFMLAPYLYRRLKMTRENVLDLLLVYAWAGMIAWFCASVSAAAYPDKGALYHWTSAAIFGLLLPTFFFSMLMTFLSVFQHTAPESKWKLADGKPSSFEDAMQGTIHQKLPEWLDFIFIRIMQHQAHHLNVHIDLHAIKEAQSKVSAVHDGWLVKPWTPSYHLEVVRRCKLYDPERKRWLTFEEADALRAPESPAAVSP